MVSNLRRRRVAAQDPNRLLNALGAERRQDVPQRLAVLAWLGEIVSDEVDRHVCLPPRKEAGAGGARSRQDRGKLNPPRAVATDMHGSSPARRASSAIAIGKLRRIIRREFASSEELAERTREAGPSART